MQWIYDIFMTHSALQAVIIISVIIAVGLAFGKIRVWGISLGVTFVFFAGILAGHLGLSIDPTILHYTENLGLVLFVYELGLKVGPGFFSSFRKGGLQLNLLGLGVLLIGTAMAVIFSLCLGVPIGDATGILCGATTNTPALGAAQQALEQLGLSANGAALSCAVTYPLGVVGVILGIIVLRKLLIKPGTPLSAPTEEPDGTFIAEFKVCNPAIYDMTVRQVSQITKTPFVISRLWRNEATSLPDSDTVLKKDDHLLVITTPADCPKLKVLFGKQEARDWNKKDIDWNSLDNQLISRRIIVSRPSINGKKLGKSLGNFITLDEFFTGTHPLLEQAYSPMTIRFFILQAHYRGTVDFSNEALQGAEKALERMCDGYRRLQDLKASDVSTLDGVADLEKRAYEALDDDFNTPVLIGVLFDAVRMINQVYDHTATATSDDIEALKKLFDTFLIEILGIVPDGASDAGAASLKPYQEAVDLLLQIRAEAKANKNWATSDLIRDRLAAIGFTVKDTKDGVEWKL